MTHKLYLVDSYQAICDAEVLAATNGRAALDQTAFYPGGGGQPADTGILETAAGTYAVTEVYQDDEDRVWHYVGCDLRVGEQLRGRIDWPRRYTLMRHHGLLHIVNALVLRRYSGLITGVQIGEHVSRIDFALEGFPRTELLVLQELVNEVTVSHRVLRSAIISVEQYNSRRELRRTLAVSAPVSSGTVRVVAIEGFDEQVCGGTHVRDTAEIGRCRIVNFVNKGKFNKRFYFALEEKVVPNVLCNDVRRRESN